MQHEPGTPHDARANQRRYWRGVVRWTWLGLAGWLLVTCAVSWFAGTFNRWTVAGTPAGFWLAAQGAIVAYLLIIVLHGWVMDRLEARRQDSESIGQGLTSPSTSTTP
ncbi:putative solute:sodium symporter small subunit [Sphaerotilus mobilis]|uniref:Putative solute:sodium symporter small subunit n=2 Tax=Sphaerotilus mobilis TaxID=47994 RepID=A0A4V2EX86_9BURK|nr:putative solute:sodium symporter small subunit [Sphaerotilus mobilis]